MPTRGTRRRCMRGGRRGSWCRCPRRADAGAAVGGEAARDLCGGGTAPAVGDMVLLYTDGLFEVTGPIRSLTARSDCWRRWTAHQLPPSRLFDELLGEALAFSAGKGFADDVCLLGMEVASLTPAPSAGLDVRAGIGRR